MEEMKWGLFLHGELMAEYDRTIEGYKEAKEAAAFAFEETGIPHTVQLFYWKVK